MPAFRLLSQLSATLASHAALLAVAGVLAQPLAVRADTLADLVEGKPEPHLVAEGFTFTEGPATDAKGDIYFSDIPAGKIHRWKVPAGGVPGRARGAGQPHDVGRGRPHGSEGGRRAAVVDREPGGFRQTMLEAVHFVPLKSGVA